MNGWELLIALFGGGWYVISAIAASKKKKQQKEARQKATVEELAVVQEATVEPVEHDAPDFMTGEKPLEIPVKLATGQESSGASMLQDARRSILQAMRKEMGLPPVSDARVPQAESGSLQVPQAGTTAMPPVPPAPLDLGTRERAETAPTVHGVPRRRRPRPVAASKAPTNLLSAEAIQGLLQDPMGARQAIVLAELLAPPISMRQGHLQG